MHDSPILHDSFILHDPPTPRLPSLPRLPAPRRFRQVNQNENETKDRSHVPLRNYFTPGARPATATAAASRSQASSPVLQMMKPGESFARKFGESSARKFAQTGHFVGLRTNRTLYRFARIRTLWPLPQDTTAPDTLGECLAPHRARAIG